MKNVANVTELIGNTPIVKLNNIVSEGKGEVYVKLEYFNPGGSVKDRIALNMIIKGEEQGILKENSVIVEPTSGNTGIGIAMVGAAKGYKVILVMPETMSQERKTLMRAYGAELLLTDGSKGMKGAIDKAKVLVDNNDNYVMLQQFENPNNPHAHYTYTAKEIIKQMNGNIDYFVAGVGTGGTVTGVGTVLKEELPNTKIVAVEPSDSAVLSGNKPGPHKIQGIGAGFIPKVLKTDVIDEIETITYTEAIGMVKKLGSKEGLLLGISSGAAIVAAVKIAEKIDRSKKIVVIAPDNGERYLSTGIFE